ncbi:type II toxin-antitoxin system prevent-host-death family antitoxin [Cutibacterium granulosum]|uniref:type II toxin-antitoxin system Phd/YefM family antitoxin n=1 Tax=Cutibacterium granulosum TaxID=33011 RepID=UPI002B222289|nr:type II toxin-antitoxin system prevent-host-death family antitoxin [Cutibacterium granulosum]MEA5639987.1 type II toxin-antitoxin system prevent-host-death family antitoxin [Cutibacterium granulosum]
MGRIISQRELRNDSARVLRAVDEGQSFVITRREKPVGELIPLHRDRFVDRHVVERVFAASPTIDRESFLRDVDGAVDQGIEPCD